MTDLMQQAREQFEARFRGRYNLTTRKDSLGDSVYVDRWVQGAWVGYRAALRAAPEWQPMETAPRDGAVVLVAIGASDIPQPCRFRDRVGWVIAWDEWRIPAHDGPLGWMPLPAAARPQGVKDAG